MSIENPTEAADRAKAVHAYLDDHLDKFLAELTGWVRLRSVAGLAEHSRRYDC